MEMALHKGVEGICICRDEHSAEAFEVALFIIPFEAENSKTLDGPHSQNTQTASSLYLSIALPPPVS